jgi:uncharacterized protein DUF3303
MLFMVVERFRNGDPVPVYRRFRDRGRQLPPDVSYVGSWVSADLDLCYQIMDAPSRAALDEWTSHWSDLVEFDVVPVMTSAEAVEAVAPRL